MPRHCTVCDHANIEDINRELVNNVSLRDIAGRFNLSKTSLQRHKDSHVPAALARAQDAKVIADGNTLLDQITSLQAKTLSILTTAEKGGELRTALMAIGQARDNLELLAKLSGELKEQASVNILVTSPDWLRLRSVILAAIDPYPDAKLAVIAALSHD